MLYTGRTLKIRKKPRVIQSGSAHKQRQLLRRDNGRVMLLTCAQKCRVGKEISFGAGRASSSRASRLFRNVIVYEILAKFTLCARPRAPAFNENIICTAGRSRENWRVWIDGMIFIALRPEKYCVRGYCFVRNVQLIFVIVDIVSAL